jgi:predicted RNA-binding protein with PIN domain
LETQGLGGSPRNEMTVVFDGQSGIAYPKKPSAIKVLFSSDETADDLIKRIVERVENKKNIYVITDDKALGHSVRDFGAKTLSVKDFFGKKQKSNSIPGTKSLAEPKDISTAVEFKINDELKKIWLD